MSVRTAGLVTVTLFYAIFFALGTYVGRRTSHNRTTDGLLLAGRRLPLFLGVLTMTATWLDGGYINGTAESVYQNGIVATQAPWGYALSLILGGLFFAAPMRRNGFTTMVDLFDRRYGKRAAAVLFVPAVLGEILWSAMILAALGTTFSTILEIDQKPAVLLSAAIAVAYTVRGGLWAVAWTDALQFFFMAGGLCLAIPFLLDHVGGISSVWTAYQQQLGANASLFPPSTAFQLHNASEAWGWGWLDTGLLLILGGIPWQVYFQRVLACKTERTAVAFSVCAGFLCLAMSLPPALIGAIGRTIDWSNTAVGPPANASLILPYLLRNLTPPLVAAVGLGAIAAAVMSSIDSSFLSASSMFVWNVYRPLVRPSAGHAEIRLMVRVAILVAGAGAAALALVTTSIYSLWVLCSDLVYVVLFPQLVCALFVRWTNAPGAMAGAFVGLALRIAAGEPALGIPALITLPGSETHGFYVFPYRTAAMLSGWLTLLVVSRLTRTAFPPRSLALPSTENSPSAPDPSA
jgi:solute carrier family 5 (high affinity choline transporter), member 7